MATPYLQMIVEDVPSTQDLARSELADLPLVVIAPGQSAGRGRSGATWENADRALAVSVAWRVEGDDLRPFSLMAGVAAVRALGNTVQLKWPNDVLKDGKKIGGILVERADGVVTTGMGLNLFWVEPFEGAGSLNSSDPGHEAFKQIGALWAAELMRLVDGEVWPMGEYREACATLGRDITWEPDGKGTAVDIAESGALVVETGSGRTELVAGAVRHIR
jgi:BirA family transcriptional regulator, biotin operon repressor / biotin---[acetyl-CoA-carboxylase] ligase